MRRLLMAAATTAAITGTGKAAPILLPCSDCRLPTSSASVDYMLRGAHDAPAQHAVRDDYFRLADVAAKGLTDRVSMQTFASRAGRFGIEAARHTARSATMADQPGISREKLSVATLALRYADRIGPDDIVTFSVRGSREKRRFAFDLSGGHLSTSLTFGVEADWRHGSSWRVATGYRSDVGSGRSNGLLRTIELASGATRSQQGPWAAISYSPGGDQDRHDLSFGVRVQSMRLAGADRLAIGAARSSDNRAALTASWHFR